MSHPLIRFSEKKIFPVSTSRCPVLLLTLVLLGTTAFAQIGGTGSLQGTITDPSGAVVPDATVTATNASTNAAVTQQTSSAGFYSLAALPPGSYTITVTASGFQKLDQKNITVDALSVATVNLAMTLGAATDVVSVMDASPQIETSNATLGSVMRNEQYSALPLAMKARPSRPNGLRRPGSGRTGSQLSGRGQLLRNIQRRSALHERGLHRGHPDDERRRPG